MWPWEEIKKSITGRITRLRNNGTLKYYSKKVWTTQEIEAIIANIQFDENGYVSNYPALAQLVNKRVTQVQTKVARLRREGRINVNADRTKTSVKSKEAMNKFNDARFAQYKKEEKPVPEKVAQTNVKVETQSKVVQMIMTVVVAGNEKTINFFSMEGELLAVKKEAIE
ncbi:hypothetical protein [Enterococcus sp. BWB1-3]|uniref:hypothetical protein n=1 Tax=Enterococcus sp. BWB1-3 TaxID=2787713 RepID=UPI001F35E3A1|nr:hypothetical protein [Enterococcus sp. BWB1-3]